MGLKWQGHLVLKPILGWNNVVGTGNDRGPAQPITALGHSIPGNKCRKLSGCSCPPSYTPLKPTSGLLLQPCLCPSPVSPCEVPGDTPGAHAGAAPSTLPCVALPTSGIFSSPPEVWKGPGQTGPFTHHSYRIPITIP